MLKFRFLSDVTQEKKKAEFLNSAIAKHQAIVKVFFSFKKVMTYFITQKVLENDPDSRAVIPFELFSFNTGTMKDSDESRISKSMKNENLFKLHSISSVLIGVVIIFVSVSFGVSCKTSFQTVFQSFSLQGINGK